MQIKELRLEDVARWDDFAATCAAATFFHRAGWKEVIERTFGHPTYYLYAEHDGVIRGILPIGHISSPLFGNALISTPFCVYGGIAAESEAAARALDNAAKQLAARLDVDYLELRHREPGIVEAPSKDLYVTFRKEISADPDVNMQSIPRKQRAMVRKGIKSGLDSVVDQRVDRFFELYSESVRNLGTPVLPKRWFESVQQVFADACEVLTVVHQGHPVSSVLSFYFRDEVLPFYAGGAAAARRMKANDFMYWELMRRAGERGVRIFDYGRSKKQTGSYSFKKNWGFEPSDLHYAYHLVRARQVPDINPMNPRFRLMVEMWKKIPLGLATRIGPMISRYLA